MANRVKRYVRLSEAEKAEIRRRLLCGESAEDIRRAVGRDGHTIRDMAKTLGGPPRHVATRSARHLSWQDREDISLGLCRGNSFAAIGRTIGRPGSTISREVNANGGAENYRPGVAEALSQQKMARPRIAKLDKPSNTVLRELVVNGLRQHWSPQQISERLVIEFPHDLGLRVSHETIYKALYVQAKGSLKAELSEYLRSGKTQRNQRTVTKPGSRIVGMINISERPSEAEDRSVPGHWEGDLIMGAYNRSAIATLVERSTRYTLLVALRENHGTEAVVQAMGKKIKSLPLELRRSLTWDQGVEMASHAKFSIATDIPVFFCDPHSPWQRGTNENTNGLLRQYFPKGTDLSVYDQAYLDSVARELNGRPRKTLGFMKPSEQFAELIATTA